jgi:hypothetical protein
MNRASIIGKIFKSNFLINLFEDINVAHIFYKSNQTYGTHIKGDEYFRMEGGRWYADRRTGYREQKIGEEQILTDEGPRNYSWCACVF